MGELRNIYKSLLGKSEWEGSREIPKGSWEDNIKNYVAESD
jgi:hypothetical protein